MQTLLQTAFEAHPECTYCVMSVPSVQPHIPLLSYFVVSTVEIANNDITECIRVRIRQRAISRELQTKSNLYVLHRNALLSSITVRPIDVAVDENGICQFLQSVSNGHELAADLQDEEASTFVIVMEKQIIGLCVIQLSIPSILATNDGSNPFDLQLFERSALADAKLQYSKVYEYEVLPRQGSSLSPENDDYVSGIRNALAVHCVGSSAIERLHCHVLQTS